MIKVKMKATAVDALGHEQEIDVYLDVDEQSSSHGRVYVYGAADWWRAAFVPEPPFDPYARTPVEVLGVKATPAPGPAKETP